MRSSAVAPLPVVLARSFIAAAAICYVYDLLRQTHDHLTNGAGRPFGDDFINYWSAAFLAWHGRAAEIYNPLAFHAFQQSVVGAPLDGYHYSYPPVLLLLTLPLAFVPYLPALALWLAAGWYGFYRALRLAMPNGGALLLAAATPAALINAIGGQNGTWTAALFGGGLGLLQRRPGLGGVLLGLLIYKPQLGLLVPIALLAGRQWRAFIAAGSTAGLLIAASIICFGIEPWSEYFRNLAILREMVLEDGTGVFHRMVSVFVAARRLGASIETAYVIQGLCGAAAAASVAVVWFRNSSANIKNAVLLLGTCLATPYLQDYDLVFGALAVAWLWQEPIIRERLQRPLYIASALLLIAPVFTAGLANLTGFAFGPLFILPLFVVAMRGLTVEHRSRVTVSGPARFETQLDTGPRCSAAASVPAGLAPKPGQL
jgi:hypothetical protein